jgi:hypothetical protein
MADFICQMLNDAECRARDLWFYFIFVNVEEESGVCELVVVDV